MFFRFVERKPDLIHLSIYSMRLIWINWRWAKYNDSATCTTQQTRNQRRNGRQNWCSLFVVFIWVGSVTQRTCTSVRYFIFVLVFFFSYFFYLFFFFHFQFSSFLTTKQIERKWEKQSNRHTHTHISLPVRFFSFICYWCHGRELYTHRGCSSVNFICTLRCCSGLKAEFVLLLLLHRSNKKNKKTNCLIVFLFFSFFHFYMRLFRRVLNMCVVVFLVSPCRNIENMHLITGFFYVHENIENILFVLITFFITDWINCSILVQSSTH